MIGKSKASSRIFNRFFENSLFRDSHQVNSRLNSDDSSESENESVASHDEVDFTGIGSSKLLTQSLDGLRGIPLTDHEIQAGITSLRERSDLVRHAVPSILTIDRMDRIFEGVKSVLSDQLLIGSAVKMINQKPMSPIFTAFSAAVSQEVPSPIEMSQGIIRTFNDLREEFSCVICQDLLAAPVALSCGHSLCGACYLDLKDSCTSSDAEVEAICPLDKISVSRANYVRVFDNHICQEVSKMPASVDKMNWVSRRRKYFSRTQDHSKLPAHENFEGILDEIKYPIAVLSVITLILIFIARNNAAA